MGSPTVPGLTTPTRKALDDLMSRRLNTLVPLERATLATVADASPRAVPSATKMPCLNPNCLRKVTRPKAGRLPLFCSRSCREAFDYERAELLADIAVLLQAIERGEGTHAQRRKVLVELANRRWCLQRYAVPPDRNRPELHAAPVSDS